MTTHGYLDEELDEQNAPDVLKWAPFVVYDGGVSYRNYRVPSTGNEYGINKGEKLVLNNMADMMHFIEKMKKTPGDWRVVFAQKRWPESDYEAMKKNVSRLINRAKKEGIKKFDTEPLTDKESAEVVIIQDGEAITAPKKSVNKRKRRKANEETGDE